MPWRCFQSQRAPRARLAAGGQAGGPGGRNRGVPQAVGRSKHRNPGAATVSWRLKASFPPFWTLPLRGGLRKLLKSLKRPAGGGGGGQNEKKIEEQEKNGSLVMTKELWKFY